jgi:peptide/nickel transport system substrate-binding protein
LIVIGLIASIAAQCGATPTPEKIIEKVVETVIVQETVEVIVEGTPQVVEKEVIKEVEVEVVVTPTPEPPGKKVLVLANAEPTQGTSPLTGGTSVSMRVWELTFDALWDRDENFEAVPWLAERWETNDDYSEWTFYLRDGLTFSDGSQITAEDVKASFEYLGTSELWKGKVEQIESIEVIDPLTVKFTMVRPLPEFLVLPGSNVQFSIFSKKALDAGADYNNTGQEGYSGPYVLKEYVPKSHLVLEKNPNYWKEGYPKFDEILFSFTEDSTAAVAAVESGAAHFYFPTPAKDIPRLQLMSTVNVYMASSGSYIGFGFDRTRPPFNDSRVRRAIALLLEADERSDVCWFGTADSLYGGFIYPYQQEFYDGFEPYKTERAGRIEEAKALLDEAGWVEGPDGMRVSQGVEGLDDGTPFEVNVPYEANWPQAECHTQLLQNWGLDAGLNLKPERYDPGNFWNDAIDSKHQMWHAGIPGALFAPNGLYEVFHSKGSWNPYWFHGSEPELDEMLDNVMAETDMAKKKELLHEVNVKLFEEAYVVADGSQNSPAVATAKLKGYFPRSDDSTRALILAEMADE